jgi:hypothetical protein
MRACMCMDPSVRAWCMGAYVRVAFMGAGMPRADVKCVRTCVCVCAD